LKSLPTSLPPTLEQLVCHHNDLTCLPSSLPASLKAVDCTDNPQLFSFDLRQWQKVWVLKRHLLAQKYFRKWKQACWKKRGVKRLTECIDEIKMHPLSYKVQRLYEKSYP
jgi:hypothetical protein